MLYPKIGIRPVIDGRWGGVRESLENQTVTMANNAAKLISGTLRYPDGKPVECVVGCTTIGGGAEAARVAEPVQHAERGGHTVRHTLLVLRHRDVRHGPEDDQGCVGLQRNRSARARCIWPL